MIQTNTVDYWGFRTHPFADYILRGDSLRLFVDREEELFDVEDALGHSRVVGVHGSLGVGKSSFLQKLREEIVKGQKAVAFVHLTADSRETLYREVLKEVLQLCRDGHVSLERGHGIKIDQELLRLEASISDDRGADVGARLAGLGGDFKASQSIKTDPHTESTALSTLARVFDAVRKPLIVILDDFEKLQYGSPDQSGDYFPVLSRFVTTLEQRLNRDTVSFVVSLDERFTRLVEQTRKRGGAFAFSLNSLVELRNFHPQQLVKFISVRLRGAGWKKPLDAFLPGDVFWALSVASGNHPRRVLRILAEAMKVIARHGRKAQLDYDSLVAASRKTGDSIDERNMSILRYLSEKRGASESDKGFLKAVGLTSRSSLSRRLSQVQLTLGLEMRQVKSGKTQKRVYSLPNLDYR